MLNFCTTLLSKKNKNFFIFLRCMKVISTIFLNSIWFQTWKNPLGVSIPGSCLLCSSGIELQWDGTSTISLSLDSKSLITPLVVQSD